MIQEYLFGCDRHRRRKGKGESAERGGGLVDVYKRQVKGMYRRPEGRRYMPAEMLVRKVTPATEGGYA